MQKSTWIIDIINVIGVADTNIRMLLIVDKASKEVIYLKTIPNKLHPITLIEIALMCAKIKPNLIIVDDRKEVLEAYNILKGFTGAKRKTNLCGIKIIDEKGKPTSKPQEEFKGFLLQKIETDPHTQTLTIPEFEDYITNICESWNNTRRRMR